jgi:phosphate transport system protein
MVRADFDRSLEDLQDELLQLGQLVETAILKSMDALQSGDTALANEVIREDDVIDQKRFALEERSVDLIATQQPLAIDLRTLLSVLHIAVELERIGDYAEGIGKICLIIADGHPAPTLDGIKRMAELGVGMLRGSLKSLADRDVDLANRVWSEDDEVDSLYADVCRRIFEQMTREPQSIQAATHLLWVAHDLERIADRSTNIAERVIFLVTGEITPPSGSHEEPA